MSLMRIAMVAGCATALFGPSAFGQDPSWTQVPAPPLASQREENTWTGSASCNVTASSPKEDVNYQGGELHKWRIIPWVIYTDSKDTFYAENWTANGGGQNGQNQNWTVDAKGSTPGYLQFWVPIVSSLLHIRRWSSQQEDPHGTTTRTIRSGITISSVITPTKEIDFPTSIAAEKGFPDTIKGGFTGTTVGSILANEPSDGVNIWECSWDFEFQPLLSRAPTGSLEKPPLLAK
jgi:hypothetical protein